MRLIECLLLEEDGQGLAEYILIIALVSVAFIFLLTNFGGSIDDIIGRSNNDIDNALTE